MPSDRATHAVQVKREPSRGFTEAAVLAPFLIKPKQRVSESKILAQAPTLWLSSSRSGPAYFVASAGKKPVVSSFMNSKG